MGALLDLSPGKQQQGTTRDAIVLRATTVSSSGEADHLILPTASSKSHHQRAYSAIILSGFTSAEVRDSSVTVRKNVDTEVDPSSLAPTTGYLLNDSYIDGLTAASIVVKAPAAGVRSQSP